MEDNHEVRGISISEKTLRDLNTIRKWSMFFAILGFIAVGLMLILGLVTGLFLLLFDRGPALPGIPEPLMIVLILALGVLFFFPLFFLSRFSKHTGRSVKTLDVTEFEKAFMNLRRYIVYMGILVIMILLAYFIVFLFAGASVAFIRDLGTAI